MSQLQLFEIKSWRGTLLYSAEGESLRAVLEAAVKAGADLRYAVLGGADLSGAVLRGAVLRYAVLGGADLSGADLSGADLRATGLRGADLSGADLIDADLRGADLSGADLIDAVLRGAVLSGAVLRGADLSGAVLSGVPQIPSLHRRMLAAIEAGGTLDMANWHGQSNNVCGTTHCRAGWCVALAGEAGRELQKRVGPGTAGLLISLKSGIDKVPSFYASNEDALADIKRCAELEPPIEGEP